MVFMEPPIEAPPAHVVPAGPADPLSGPDALKIGATPSAILEAQAAQAAARSAKTDGPTVVDAWLNSLPPYDQSVVRGAAKRIADHLAGQAPHGNDSTLLSKLLEKDVNDALASIPGGKLEGARAGMLALIRLEYARVSNDPGGLDAAVARLAGIDPARIAESPRVRELLSEKSPAERAKELRAVFTQIALLEADPKITAGERAAQIGALTAKAMEIRGFATDRTDHALEEAYKTLGPKQLADALREKLDKPPLKEDGKVDAVKLYLDLCVLLNGVKAADTVQIDRYFQREGGAGELHNDFNLAMRAVFAKAGERELARDLGDRIGVRWGGMTPLTMAAEDYAILFPRDSRAGSRIVDYALVAGGGIAASSILRNGIGQLSGDGRSVGGAVFQLIAGAGVAVGTAWFADSKSMFSAWPWEVNAAAIAGGSGHEAQNKLLAVMVASNYGLTKEQQEAKRAAFAARYGEDYKKRFEGDFFEFKGLPTAAAEQEAFVEKGVITDVRQILQRSANRVTTEQLAAKPGATKEEIAALQEVGAERVTKGAESLRQFAAQAVDLLQMKVCFTPEELGKSKDFIVEKFGEKLSQEPQFRSFSKEERKEVERAFGAFLDRMFKPQASGGFVAATAAKDQYNAHIEKLFPDGKLDKEGVALKRLLVAALRGDTARDVFGRDVAVEKGLFDQALRDSSSPVPSSKNVGDVRRTLDEEVQRHLDMADTLARQRPYAAVYETKAAEILTTLAAEPWKVSDVIQAISPSERARVERQFEHVRAGGVLSQLEQIGSNPSGTFREQVDLQVQRGKMTSEQRIGALLGFDDPTFDAKKVSEALLRANTPAEKEWMLEALRAQIVERPGGLTARQILVGRMSETYRLADLAQGGKHQGPPVDYGAIRKELNLPEGNPLAIIPESNAAYEKLAQGDASTFIDQVSGLTPDERKGAVGAVELLSQVDGQPPQNGAHHLAAFWAEHVDEVANLDGVKGAYSALGKLSPEMQLDLSGIEELKTEEMQRAAVKHRVDVYRIGQGKALEEVRASLSKLTAGERALLMEPRGTTNPTTGAEESNFQQAIIRGTAASSSFSPQDSDLAKYIQQSFGTLHVQQADLLWYSRTGTDIRPVSGFLDGYRKAYKGTPPDFKPLNALIDSIPEDQREDFHRAVKFGLAADGDPKRTLDIEMILRRVAPINMRAEIDAQKAGGENALKKRVNELSQMLANPQQSDFARAAVAAYEKKFGNPLVDDLRGLRDGDGKDLFAPEVLNTFAPPAPPEAPAKDGAPKEAAPKKISSRSPWGRFRIGADPHSEGPVNS